MLFIFRNNDYLVGVHARRILRRVFTVHVIFVIWEAFSGAV